MRQFSDEIRADIAELVETFNRCERAQSEYEERFCSRLVLPSGADLSTAARNGPHFLLASLCRVRGLLEVAIVSVNERLPHGLFLSVRAHLETAGSVAHLKRHLQRLYRGEIGSEAFERTLVSLCLGTRWAPDQADTEKRVGISAEAINAITLVESAATVMGELCGSTEARQLVNDQYAYLSEYCHPNRAGRRFAVEYLPGLSGVQYAREPTLEAQHIVGALGALEGSHLVFLHAFDTSLEWLGQHERLPLLQR